MASRIRIGNTEQALRRVQAADLASRQAATTILSPDKKKITPRRPAPSGWTKTLYGASGPTPTFR